MQPSQIKYLLSLLILLLLAGCSPTPLIKDPYGQIESDPQFLQAIELESTDFPLEAAKLFELVALKVGTPAKEELLLRAAENYFKGQDTDKANAILDKINLSSLPGLDFQKRLLVAELALAKNHPGQALALLSPAPPAEANQNQLRRYHTDLAEGHRLSGDLLESARELGELDLLLTEMEAKLENQLAILQTLATLTDTALDLLQPNPPGIQGGWMELARIIKGSVADQGQIQNLIENWRERFPSHPAIPELLDNYFQRPKAQYRQPDHIAVLLPESGRYAKAGKALKQGFMAAYYQQPTDNRPRLAFYDSSNSADTWPLYRSAIDSGAEMIIGPLNKESVAILANAGELEIPVLALNQVASDVSTSANLFQFGLAPEDEAGQVAERAWLDGHTQAITLTPSGNWGNRVFNAFRNRWERLGGTLNEQQQYNAKNDDFSAPIKSLLNIDDSTSRKNRLQKVLGKNVEYQPRRRQDTDFIFMAAQHQKARQIRPQLQFHHASTLPIYSTSHIYSGLPNPAEDQDLEGIKFPDIPWLLIADAENPLSRENMAKTFPQSQGRYGRLYAMGMDSFNLLPHLARLQSSTRELVDGYTGNLYLDRTQQVRRRLVWAVIKKGIPHTIGYAPHMETGEDLLQAPVNEPLPLPSSEAVPATPGTEPQNPQPATETPPKEAI